jgi:hypothetical protein
MTTAHDLAHLLLEGPDLPVITARELDLEEVNGVEPYEPIGQGWWDGDNFHKEPAVLLW